MRNSRLIHLLVKGRQVFVDDFLHLRRSISYERRKFRQLFFLLCAWRSGKVVKGFHSNGGPALPRPCGSRWYFRASESTFFCNSSVLLTMSSVIFLPFAFAASL